MPTKLKTFVGDLSNVKSFDKEVNEFFSKENMELTFAFPVIEGNKIVVSACYHEREIIKETEVPEELETKGKGKK